ncbi:MAG: PAS domain S-box protein [Sedimentisphaerales bacterium]|nr:PAS domain S-box protein [Sedimentisphaerales bacterium]
MKQTFEIIFNKAKTYCRDETDYKHMVSALEIAKKLISLEGGDESIIIPAIIMHDIGWHLFSYDEELKARGPAIKNVELNHKHEIESAALANSILSELNYPEEKKGKVVEIINGHDNRSKPVSKEDMIVKDADRLSRYTPECFDGFRLKFKYSEGEFFDILKSKIERWLFTDSARYLAREYLLKRRLGIPDVEFTDGVRDNLYKILIGLEGEVVKMVKEKLELIAIQTVKEKVYDTKRMIEIYLADREYIDVEQLQHDEEFQSIATQKVSERGYIGVIDRESGCIIFHPNRRIINMPLDELKNKERTPEYLYGFWDWFDRALKGEEFFSYYQGKNEKDEIVDKFQYVVPLNIKNAKWSINSSALYDEFFKSIDILNTEIVKSVSEIADQAGYLADQVEQRTRELAESNKGLQKEIAERKEAEKALRKAEERYRIQFEGALDSIFIADSKTGLLIDCNPAATRLVEREKSELIGQHQRILHPQEKKVGEFSRTFKQHLEDKPGQTLETQIITKTGEIRDVAIKANLLEIDGKEVMQGIFRDITERKRAEESAAKAFEELKNSHQKLKELHTQLVQSEKLASIGQLAAGVAHEINNPIGFVAGNFQALENYMKKIQKLLDMHDKLAGQVEALGNPELRKEIENLGRFREDMQIDFILEDIQRLFDESKEGLDRTTNIVQNLRDFSRIDQPGSRDEYNLNDGIKSTLVVARNEIKYNADVETELSELPKIFCHSGQINQVLLNIIVNAAQAIKSQERNDRGTIKIRTYGSDDEAVCEISDDGPGIPPEMIPKIFDPFFTTKPPGKGTGLGLSVSYDIIVNKHNGEFFVDSVFGEGTKFTIKLPIGTKENNEDEIKSHEKVNSITCK